MSDRSLSNTDRDRNETASVWMHRGMDLAATGNPAVLDEAIRCFDEAIALRRMLPLHAEPFYRYGLSAGWINRGDAFARLGGSSLDEAVRSYAEALALLETLVLDENALYPRRLAITRLNRGVALQKRDGPGDAMEAAASFRGAIGILVGFPDTTISDRQALQAAAWGNLAATLASRGRDAAAEARAAARNALALAKPSEATDPVAAETALGARHALCRLLVRDLAGAEPIPDALLAEATDAVEEALATTRTWGERPGFAQREREIVRFGCRIYAAAQPRFLAEFVVERLGLGPDAETDAPDPETAAAAQAGIWTALDRLQAGGFASPALLDEVRELRAAQEKLARRTA